MLKATAVQMYRQTSWRRTWKRGTSGVPTGFLYWHACSINTAKILVIYIFFNCYILATKSFLRGSDDRLCKIKMIGEIRQNFTEASASVGLILATALIIVPNWVIWTWRFTAICFAVSIVTSLFTACATWAGLIDLQFLEFSAFFPFLILTLERSISCWWKCMIALRVSCSACLQIWSLF